MQSIILKIQNIRQSKSFKDFFYLLASNLAVRPIQFIKGIIIAKYIDPNIYGLYRSGELITMLNKFGNLGFNSTAQREVGTALGENDDTKAKYYRLSCYSGEFSLALVLVILGLCGSLTALTNEILFWVIVSAASTLFFSKLNGIYNTEAIIQKKFKIISTSTFFSSLISSVLTICLLPFYSIFALLFFPIAQEIITNIFYWNRISLQVPLKLFHKSIRKTLKTSMTFSMSTLAFGGFKYLERIFIISFLGTIALGFFSFATMIAEQVSQFVFMMVKVRKQKLFEEIAKKNYLKVHKIVRNETRFFLLTSLIIIPLLVLMYKFLIPIYLPKWIEAIEACNFMLALIPLKIAGSYEAIVIVSPLVNKQIMLTKGLLASISFLSLGVILTTIFYKLTLKQFIFYDLGANLIYIIIINLTYHKYFYLKFVKPNAL